MTPLGGSTSIDNYTDINPLPIVNGDTLKVSLYNTGSNNVYNMSVSVMIMERSVYQHSISPETLSPTLNVTKDGGHIYAQRCGNIVHISFFASLNDLPPNGSSKLIMSGLPKAICRTTGFIAAQYANYVGYFFADTDGCLYLENKSNVGDAYWVVGNITYFTND